MFSLALVALTFAIAVMAIPISLGYITTSSSSSVEDPKNVAKNNIMGADVDGRSSVPLNYATPHLDRDAGRGSRDGRGASRRDAQRGGTDRGRGSGRGRGGTTRDTARSANADPGPAEDDYFKHADYGGADGGGGYGGYGGHGASRRDAQRGGTDRGRGSGRGTRGG